ncbi:putative wall-associated receptor kinase-like 16 [Phalaenopsis equestris]|uniref:putative wall-associated receptor kinase-like 16 n=1 Tax=Phalaenopsis equestris TaxID=78828 RepID=UPI0009E237C3|nr:putative wall-associated receptor kinase-like 16 [Phalaenopsis equestris]
MWGINENFFQQNGGRILRQRLTELNISPPTFRIFTAEELELATDGYNESRSIGEASNGCSTVYKGIIYDRIVAIKRWCHVNEPRVKQFLSELVTLSMLPADKHIVRLLGACCDDTPVPVVVYEYVPNGTLYHHVHELHGSGLSWEARLRIAAKTAEALACLHSAIPDPQFHRGVSTKDILLDEGMEPKVPDFGARLVKVSCLVVSKIMKDREGNWDPMFVKISGRPTEKGDMQAMDENFFEQNAGQIFRQRLTELNLSPRTFQILTAEELDLATDGYSESRIIGPGSNTDSIVYRGLLPAADDNNTNHRIVAVKKWISFGEHHIDQFINELLILSNLPADEHIVRILGAGCDETPFPVVVYEYMPNGTLHHHIHDLHGSLSWEARLRIAAVTANALACLHSAIPNPQFHRGVKAKDILLDEGMEAKVSDFGARLMMVGCFTFLRIKKDREGYLEPESKRFAGWTVEKGDVYSFGVVMAELLTGELPVSSEGVELGKRFGEWVAEGRLVDMLEERVKEEAVGKGGLGEAVAEVATRCLMVEAEDRPTMREVAEELQRLMRRYYQGRNAGEGGGAA